jgi:carboxymethylenebutenolidase
MTGRVWFSLVAQRSASRYSKAKSRIICSGVLGSTDAPFKLRARTEPNMTEHHIDIPTADGAMNSLVVHPDTGGSHPVVLVYMDALGKREELHDMARRLAAAGYCVVLPNLFYRRSRDYVLKERTESAMAELFAHMGSLNAATTECDTRALLSFVDALPQADATRIGAVGYCMSGPLLVWAAVEFADRLRSIAVIHGANMATDAVDSPHRVIEKIQCESYFACAESDSWAPPSDIAKLQLGLAASGSSHRIEWYPGTQHGFVFPQRVGMYQQAAAELHWVRLFDLFGRTLLGTS